MRANSKRLAVTLLTFSLLLSVVAIVAYAQNQTRLANSNGTGTLKLGREEFKVNAVIVKLLDNGQAELTLVSDITVFLNGKWSTSAANAHEFTVEITGGAAGSNLDGGGKVALSDDDKSVKQLNLKGSSRLSKRNFEVTFAGQ